MDGTDIFFRPLRGALPAWIDARCLQYPVSGGNDYLDLLPLVREACRSCDDFFVLGWSFSVPWPVIRVLRRAATASVARLFPFVSELLARLGGYTSDPFRRDRAECWARVPPSILATRARAILGMNRITPRLTCHVPLLYVGGSSDVVVPSWNARAVTRAIPTARVVTIDGPHLALYTNPEAAARTIVQFIRENN